MLLPVFDWIDERLRYIVQLNKPVFRLKPVYAYTKQFNQFREPQGVVGCMELEWSNVLSVQDVSGKNYLWTVQSFIPQNELSESFRLP